MEYVQHKLASGLTVGLRGRSYDEWDAYENERLSSLEQTGHMFMDGQTAQAEIKVGQDYRAFREKRLALWVADWPAVRGTLSLRDVAEIERVCADLEKEEVEQKN